MRMDDAIHVAACLEDFAMNKDLAVARRCPRQHLAVEIDGENGLRRNFIEADAVRLHEKLRRLVLQPNRDMTAGEVALPFGGKNLAGEDQSLAQFVVAHGRAILATWCEVISAGCEICYSDGKTPSGAASGGSNEAIHHRSSRGRGGHCLAVGCACAAELSRPARDRDHSGCG